MMRTISRLANRVLFGSSVARESDVVAAWGSIGRAYALNVTIVFLVIAVIFTATGHYHPFSTPLDEAELRFPLAISNLSAFALTLIASLDWSLSDEATERQRAANRSQGEYLVLLSALWVASLLFLAAVFFSPGFMVVLGGVCVQSALFQITVSQRALKSRNVERQP